MKTTPFKYLVEAVEKKEAQLKKIIENRRGVGNSPSVTVKYELNSVRALGTYQLVRGHIHTINLNAALLNELKEKYINEVFVHEYAHACVEYFHVSNTHGKRVMPHGKEFKAFCRELGCTPSATTGIASNSNVFKSSMEKKGNKFLYMCGCQEFFLTTTRHNKIVSGTSKYKCRKCGETVKQKH